MPQAKIPAPHNCSRLLLQTNNPRKINQLTLLGIDITGRVPCLVEAGEFNQVGTQEKQL